MSEIWEQVVAWVSEVWEQVVAWVSDNPQLFLWVMGTFFLVFLPVLVTLWVRGGQLRRLSRLVGELEEVVGCKQRRSSSYRAALEKVEVESKQRRRMKLCERFKKCLESLLSSLDEQEGGKRTPPS